MKVTTYSASFYEEEDEKPSKTEGKLEKLLGNKADDIMMTFTVILSVIIAVALFILLPLFLSDLLGKYIRNAQRDCNYRGTDQNTDFHCVHRWNLSYERY